MALKLRTPQTRTGTEQPEREPEDQTRAIRRAVAPVNGTKPVSDSITPLSSSEIMSGDELREFILLAGKDGVGKSCAVVSLAAYVELVAPEAKFWIIDSENKVRTALKSFGADAPQNIVYYKTDNMNQVTWAVDQILAQHSPGDWLAVESMSRIWERSQDLGYQAIAGMMKAEYMDRRAEQVRLEGGKPAPVTPSPDQLWNIVKGAHDGAFLDRLTACETLNVLLTTTLSRPPKEGGFMKENVERKSLRIELGIDAGIEGAPRLPYYVECLALLELKNGIVTCRVLRDNKSTNDETRGEFIVENKKSWAADFYSNCR
jgi:hypothetical protein